MMFVTRQQGWLLSMVRCYAESTKLSWQVDVALRLLPTGDYIAVEIPAILRQVCAYSMKMPERQLIYGKFVKFVIGTGRLVRVVQIATNLSRN